MNNSDGVSSIEHIIADGMTGCRLSEWYDACRRWVVPIMAASVLALIYRRLEPHRSIEFYACGTIEHAAT